jgi:16S rRNA G966 N2-methylase RsmD
MSHVILLIIVIVLFCIICYQIYNLFRIRKYIGSAEFPNGKKFIGVAATHYSVASDPHQTIQEIKIFKSLFKSKFPKEIIDATAHVGVDSITLAYSFPKANITSIEIDKKTYEALQYNIKNLKYSNQITALNMSADVYLRNFNKKVDLIYMDPPWGGRGYKPASDLPLYDKSGTPTIPLSEVINLALTKTNLLVLKAPYNFKVDEFKENITGEIENIHQIYKLNDLFRPSFIFIIIKSQNKDKN